MKVYFSPTVTMEISTTFIFRSLSLPSFAWWSWPLQFKPNRKVFLSIPSEDGPRVGLDPAVSTATIGTVGHPVGPTVEAGEQPRFGTTDGGMAPGDRKT